MADLRKRFGRLVAAHRRRRRMTQVQLAAAADLSPDMIVKIESGANGARFPAIERIAVALEIDPAELFTTEIPRGAIQSGTFSEVAARLANFSEKDLKTLLRVLDALSNAE